MNEEIEEYLHYRAGCQNLLLHTGLHGGTADCSKVAHGVFSGYGLPRSRLSAHYDGLIPLISYRRTKKRSSGHPVLLDILDCQSVVFFFLI